MSTGELRTSEPRRRAPRGREPRTTEPGILEHARPEPGGGEPGGGEPGTGGPPGEGGHGRSPRGPAPAARARARPEPGRASTVALALAGGLLTDAAFPGRSLWPAAVLGVALLVLGVRRDSARWAAVVGLAWGVAFFLPHLYWLHASVGAIPWVALTLTEAAFVAAFGAAWVWCRRGPALLRRPVAAAAIFAALWVLVEQARSVFPFGGFPWARLAFSQTDAPALALASLGGAPLVSAVVAGAGYLLAHALVTAHRRPGSAVGALAGCGILISVGHLVPLPAGSAGAGGEDGDALRIAAVQGDVVEPGLEAFARRLEVLRHHVDGTRAVARSVGAGELDVVLWPENAADVDPRADARAEALVSHAAASADAPILVGTLRYDDLGRYNDSVLWTPEDGPVAVYTKQHPAPFGEYIPMRGFARLFSDKVDLVRTDMLPGTEVGIVPVAVPRLDRTVPLAVAICFEVAYDGIVREAVLAGGEVVVVQTNNASFGWTQESVQQLAMTRLRAVEHGRTAVQVSTVGVSGIIAPDGTVLERTELFTADEMVAEVPLRSGLTLADRLGDGPVWGAAVIALAALAWGVASGRGSSRAARSRPGGGR